MNIPEKYRIFLLLAAGLLVRLLAFQIDFAFDNDVLTFQRWAIYLHEHGFAAFYASDIFSDYPPVYMYVLYLLGFLRSLFGWQELSPLFNFFTFLPAILADLAIGFVLYRLAKALQTPKKRRLSDSTALILAAAFVFNPAVILISSVWGQVESVFTLTLLVSLLFLRGKKLLPAYLLFGIAILTKPQSLFLGPVYLYSAYNYLWENKYTGRAVLRLAGSIASGAAVMLLVSLPFGLLQTIQQLWTGMDSYNFASVNAFNLWAFLGGNWRPLDTRFIGFSYAVWGVIIVLVIIAGALAALHIDRRRHEGKNFFFIVAALFILIFVFSVKMHERYLFPGLLFLLVYYLESRDKKTGILYLCFSITFFVNCVEVIRWLRGGFDLSIIAASVPIMSAANVVLAVFLLRTLVVILRGEKPRNPPKAPPRTEPPRDEPPPMGKKDIAFLCALIGVYGILAFTRLGDIRAPQTTWAPEAGAAVRVDLGEETYVSAFQFFNGARHDRPFALMTSVDGAEWEHVLEVEEAVVFFWTRVEIGQTARFFEIVPRREGLRLQEAAFRGADGELLAVSWVSEYGDALFDEQGLVPASANFMNSTYFDEIYHPRTGYEFAHRLEVYETTHPPLGKAFIALSVRAFGMTPFAWRLPGTLFGVLMLPLLYAFARQLFKSNNLALFAAFIFTFDFMLFAQTRLATIDTYVTFFILAMYFFMYMYTRGIEKNTLARSLLWLALCGAATGLAIASKWQGIYGALGLPILFFPALYKLRLRDIRQAQSTFFACFGFFIALPAMIYSLSYIPFVLASGGGLRAIWDNQLLMFNYHSYLVTGAEHDFASPWWSWPLILQPLFIYVSDVSEGVRQAMNSFGNPAVWWFGIFATIFGVYALAKKRFREPDIIFLLVAYAAQFLPWALVTRITFIYHYFPSIPFVVMLIVWFFKEHVKDRRWYFAYGGLVLALFILFFPVLSGIPVSTAFVHRFLRWLHGWVLM